ncbi:hypothetical protein [Paenibacillus elgii]|uniref:hypothetical protein n=1 Tax=Paenibacillus elgii TaxID=189691 RepID=UPI000248BFDB|nr:hypothetical protein [Paenibacillus elgii]
MPRLNRFQIMELYKSDIISALKEQGEILGNVDINSTFFLNIDEWKLPKSTTIHDFFEFLIDRKKILKPIELASAKETITKYHFSDVEVNPLDLALSLYPKVYLSHYSAVSLHDLTNEIVKSIYVNQEQSNKTSYKHPKLYQENIDAAFSKPMRETNRYFDYKQQRIYVLNGRYT